MTKFAFKRIKAVVGKQRFDALIIDGECPFEEFCTCYKNEYGPEIDMLYKYMEVVSNLQSLPETKFRELKGGKGNLREYEFKSKHLRLYAMKQKNGKIIVMGGEKSNQKKDLIKFRSRKARYEAYLKK